MAESMKGAQLPKREWERNEKEIDVCNCKYSGEFSNPQDLQRNADALASYVRKNRTKY